MDLTPEQQARLHQLLESELRAALLAARQAGAGDTELTALLAGRRQALETLLPRYDVQHPFDDPVDGGRVGEQL